MRASRRRDTVAAVDQLQVIVIDNHPVSRAACCALFRTEGVHVIADLDCREGAISVALALAPDVLIVDVTPGHESQAQLRRLREVEKRPLVLFTSSAHRDCFDAQLEGFHFVPKADLCAGEIIKALAEVRSKDPRCQ